MKHLSLHIQFLIWFLSREEHYTTTTEVNGEWLIGRNCAERWLAVLVKEGLAKRMNIPPEPYHTPRGRGHGREWFYVRTRLMITAPGTDEKVQNTDLTSHLPKVTITTPFNQTRN